MVRLLPRHRRPRWLVGGVAGWMLLSIAVLGLVATGAVVSNRHRRVTLGLSALASTVVLAVGGVAAAVAAVSGAVAVAIGIVPIVGGLVVYRLSRRAQRMAAS